MKQLTLADEIVVLMLDDNTGAIKPACAATAAISIAGGILMELSLLGRIDSDTSSLFVIDPTPIGDELLDPALKEIASESDKKPSKWWIEKWSLQDRALTKTVLERLAGAGILREENRQFLWVFSRRAYPQNTGREEREAKARVLAAIFDDAVPYPRDSLLVSLADSSGVLGVILSPEEMRKASRRIARVIALEEIGRAVKTVESDLRAMHSATAEGRGY
jgi:golgi phosphoprotein 3